MANATWAASSAGSMSTSGTDQHGDGAAVLFAGYPLDHRTLGDVLGSVEKPSFPEAARLVRHDTITVPPALADPRSRHNAHEARTSQAECRGFESRLPLHFPLHGRPIPGRRQFKMSTACRPSSFRRCLAHTPAPTLHGAVRKQGGRVTGALRGSADFRRGQRRCFSPRSWPRRAPRPPRRRLPSSGGAHRRPRPD